MIILSHLRNESHWNKHKAVQILPRNENGPVPQAPQSKKGNTYTGSLRFRLLDTNGIMIELTSKGSLKRNLCGIDPPDSKDKTSLATLMMRILHLNLGVALLTRYKKNFLPFLRSLTYPDNLSRLSLDKETYLDQSKI